MERLAQSETYYPAYQEPDSGVTGTNFRVCRLPDGFWWDFNDSSFKNSGWTTPQQAMTEDENGLWVYTTGWAIPDANSTYQIQWEVTDGGGTFYAAGPKIVVNDTAVLTAATIKTAMEADGGDLSSLMEALVNKRIWRELDGRLEIFNDSGTSQGTIAAQVSTDGTYTTAKRALI